jgi:hypothetical protein
MVDQERVNALVTKREAIMANFRYVRDESYELLIQAVRHQDWETCDRISKSGVGEDTTHHLFMQEWLDYCDREMPSDMSQYKPPNQVRTLGIVASILRYKRKVFTDYYELQTLKQTFPDIKFRGEWLKPNEASFDSPEEAYETILKSNLLNPPK